MYVLSFGQVVYGVLLSTCTIGCGAGLVPVGEEFGYLLIFSCTSGLETNKSSGTKQANHMSLLNWLHNHSSLLADKWT